MPLLINLIKPKLTNLQRNMLTWPVALGLLSIGTLWAGIAYDIHTDREVAVDQAEAQTLSLATALREHVHGVVSNADFILQRMDDDYARSSGPYALPEWITQSRFLRDTLIQVGIIGADGYALATTLPGLGQLDLRDREHFRVHLDPDGPQPFISKPVIGRGSGKPSIQITRRIQRPDGSFAGVGLVALDPAYFDQFFASMHLGPNAVISLFGRDGVTRARSSWAGSTLGVGRDLSGTSAMESMLSAAQGNYRWRSTVDGIQRIFGFSADPEYPVIVNAGMAIDDILAVNRSSELVEYAVSTVLTLVILWFVYRSARELSQRVERERRLHQSQKLEAIGQLTAGVAHDFNNVLMAIKGNTERIRNARSDSDRRSLVDTVERAAEAGERVVRNLLAYSRQQQLRPASIDVNEIVRNVADLLQAGLGSKWTVRCEITPRRAPVIGDSSQIETALLNLAINARDAMRSGGVILLETNLIGSDERHLPHDLARGNYVAIRVRDTGTGMPAQVAAKAFDPFFTTKEQGTGLGLSQVYGLAKQLGGTATIETREHVGTTVTLYLPMAQSTEVPAAVATPAVQPKPLRPETPRAGATVLVADDNRRVREIICSTISDMDYEIIEADDGPSALEALGRNPVQLAVLDVSMPGMSGIEVYRRARESGWDGAVLFVSGYVVPTEVTLIDGKPFLGKPFGAQALKDQVAQMLAQTDKPSAPSP